MSAVIKIDVAQLESLQDAIKSYQGDAESIINDVLHNQAGKLIQESIRRIIPVSDKTWKGKAESAKTGKSLRNVNGNLSVTVTTTSKYQYLYFPDDGTNTRRHAGNQQFFEKGGEAVNDDIIERCVKRLISNFE